MKSDVTIVDAGLGNPRSVLRMFEAADIEAEVTQDPRTLTDCRRIVLPGVGAFDSGAAAIERWREALEGAAFQRKVPILGICLGMQLMCRKSEEGQTKGLGWFAADVKRLDTRGSPRLKVPHMGWAEVHFTRENPLIAEQASTPRYYHVHSYHAVCDDPSDVLATAHYGEPFTTAIQREHIFGVQFHPEKSHRYGMEVLHRFGNFQC